MKFEEVEYNFQASFEIGRTRSGVSSRRDDGIWLFNKLQDPAKSSLDPKFTWQPQPASHYSYIHTNGISDLSMWERCSRNQCFTQVLNQWPMLGAPSDSTIPLSWCYNGPRLHYWLGTPDCTVYSWAPMYSIHPSYVMLWNNQLEDIAHIRSFLSIWWFPHAQFANHNSSHFSNNCENQAFIKINSNTTCIYYCT